MLIIKKKNNAKGANIVDGGKRSHFSIMLKIPQKEISPAVSTDFLVVKVVSKSLLLNTIGLTRLTMGGFP